MLSSNPISNKIEIKSNLVSSTSNRLTFFDRTRGLIMLFMALDHALFFWSSGRINNEGLPLLVNGTVTFNPLGSSDLVAALVMLLSSICAPGFLFIAGYVLALSIKKRESMGIPSSSIDRHLWYRGLLLLFLQIFVASPAFNLPMFLDGSLSILTLGTMLSLSILSTFGICFFFFVLGRRLSPWILLGVAGTLYFLSQLFLTGITKNFPFSQSIVQALQNIFFLPVPFSAEYFVNNNFPVIPWFFPMALGWLYGHTFEKGRGIAYETRRLALSGVSCISLFFLFRLLGIGDYLHSNGTWQTFLGLSKYPPSPDYFLFYLGIVFLLLYAFYKLPQTSKLGNILEGFGKTPLFFYNVHLWLYAALPALMGNFNGYSLSFGVGIWLLGLIILYPLCRAYQTWKTSNKIHLPYSRLARPSYIWKGLK